MQHLSWVVTSYLLASTVVARSTGSSVISTDVARPPGRDRALPHRIGPVRDRTEHAPVDRVQSNPGARRWWPAGGGDGRGRRPRRAARPRPLPGPLRRRVRRLGRRGAAARRLLRRQPLVAVDLLHQPSARPHCTRGDRDRLPVAAHDHSVPNRLARDARSLRRAVGRHRLHEPRRHELRLGRSGDARGAWHGHRAACVVPVRRGPRRTADPAAGALPQHDVQDDERNRIRRGLRALRLCHLHPDLPADRQGSQRHRFRPADDADDARRPRHFDDERLPDLRATGITAASRSWARQSRLSGCTCSRRSRSKRRRTSPRALCCSSVSASGS